jgi:hypothetical protein
MTMSLVDLQPWMKTSR